MNRSSRVTNTDRRNSISSGSSVFAMTVGQRGLRKQDQDQDSDEHDDLATRAARWASLEDGWRGV
jgi:hypothetical protein